MQGEKLVLFLTEDKTHYNKEQAKSHFRTMGGFQGKWSLQDGKATNGKEALDVVNFKQNIEANKNNSKQIKENVEGKL